MSGVRQLKVQLKISAWRVNICTVYRRDDVVCICRLVWFEVMQSKIALSNLYSVFNSVVCLVYRW